MEDNITCTNRETDSLPDGSSDDEEGEPDPRIQRELDRLNQSSSEINRLENELDEARTKYRSIVSGTSSEMEAVSKGKKTNIKRAREYYKIASDAKLAQSEAVKAARQYQTASSVYNAAKETVALAENRLMDQTRMSSATQLSSAWQEMLNHAIQKVTIAEKEKAKSQQDHKRRSDKFAELESRKQTLEKKFAKSIKKARPYFELKSELDTKLMQQKQNVLDLQAAIKCNKVVYNDSLRKLESISEEIHQHRKEKLWSKIPRMPCVGADNESIISDLSELDIVSALNTEEEFASDTVSDIEVGINELTLHGDTSDIKDTNNETDIDNKENVTFSLSQVEELDNDQEVETNDTERVVCDKQLDENSTGASKITENESTDNTNTETAKLLNQKNNVETSKSDEAEDIKLNKHLVDSVIEKRGIDDASKSETSADSHVKRGIIENVVHSDDEADSSDDSEEYQDCNMEDIPRPCTSGAE
ncbi:SH3 domain-binding protein 5 [Mactra antiquata]